MSILFHCVGGLLHDFKFGITCDRKGKTRRKTKTVAEIQNVNGLCDLFPKDEFYGCSGDVFIPWTQLHNHPRGAFRLLNCQATGWDKVLPAISPSNI